MGVRHHDLRYLDHQTEGSPRGIEDLQQCKKTEPGHPQAQKQESPALGRMEFVATVGARVCPANPTQQRRRSIARRYFRGPDIGSVRFGPNLLGQF
jgi:hypothetical protein